MKDSMFGIWDVQTRTMIYSLADMKQAPRCCELSTDCRSLVVGGDNGTVYLYQLPQKETTEVDRASHGAMHPAATERKVESASSMLDALEVLLNETDVAKVLTPAFVTDCLVADNVKTDLDLLAGHNIVLLAMRHGVINKGNMDTFGGAPWAIERALYAPSRHLDENQNAEIIDLVLLHAEKLGIIRSGVLHAVARDITRENRAAIRSVNECFASLNERVVNVELNSRMLQEQMDQLHLSIREFGKQFNSLVEGFSDRMQQVESHIVTLSSNLNAVYQYAQSVEDKAGRADRNALNVRNYITGKESADMYAGIAKFILSHIPIVNMFSDAIVDGVAGAAVNLAPIEENGPLTQATLNDILPHNLVNSRATMGRMQISIEGQREATAGQLIATDLTSPLAFSYVVSEKYMGQMTAPARQAVTIAIDNSSFGSLDALRDALPKLISAGGAQASGESGKINIEKELFGLHDEETGSIAEHVEYAQAYFRTLQVDSLSLDDAMEMMNVVLLKLGFDETDEDTFLNEAENVSGNALGLELNKEEFVRIFGSIRRTARKIVDFTQLRMEWTETFNKLVGQKDHAFLKLKLSGSAVIREIYKQHCKDARCMSREEAVKVLEEFAKQERGKVFREEFVDAAERTTRIALNIRSDGEGRAERRQRPLSPFSLPENM